MAETDDDLTARPMEYPGRPVAGSGVLVGDEYRHHATVEDIERELRRLSKAELKQRQAVVAVGSNACAAVMKRKLAAAGVDGCVPFLYGTVNTIAIGHSAHRSVAGFIPAAPFRRPGPLAPAVMTMLTPEQLDAVDHSEPNYRRTEIACAFTGVGMTTADVYVSLWGVIAPPGGEPFALTPQRQLHDDLRSRCPRFGDTEPPSATVALSTVLAEGGWVAESNL
ncbi:MULTISPECIES: hypothetical protein [Actinomycetes]|uniref:hypothetical protein n=1 Tax=Actinomycetes TaxID=1760 RepID=UPI0012DF1980|nr:MULTISPECIES: hypothetical protein [Actinomycetes]